MSAVRPDLIVVIGFFIVYLTTTRIFINPRRPGKWCTVTQLLMVLAILLSPDLPGWLSLLPALLGWVASGLALITVGHYFHIGMRFIEQHGIEPATDGKRESGTR